MRYGVPALLGQIFYMGWVSHSRTLPLFMEATHAVTSFAVTATLLSAIVKPFGRPFKVTDKGGDRSKPRVHWKLAVTFGLICAGSAASIVWAFVSPYAAGISQVDYFNLLWAGVAMLIAFIAFLICFELPREAEMFKVEENALCHATAGFHRAASLRSRPRRYNFSAPTMISAILPALRRKFMWIG